MEAGTDYYQTLALDIKKTLKEILAVTEDDGGRTRAELVNLVTALTAEPAGKYRFTGSAHRAMRARLEAERVRRDLPEWWNHS